MACNSQGFWTPWWWLRLSGRNMTEWLNNNKLINPKLICAFCWFVLFFTYQEVSHFVVFSSLVLFLLRRPKYFPQQPILEYPQNRNILFHYFKAKLGPSEQNLNRFKATGLTSYTQSWPFDLTMRPVAANTDDMNFMISEKWRLQPFYKFLIREKFAISQ